MTAKAPLIKAASLFDLTGQVAIVTGASSGLGTRFAQILAAHGAKTVLVARRPELLAKHVKNIQNDGGIAIPVTADVTKADDITSMLDQVEAALRDTGLPAHRLELEITESVMLQESDATSAALHRLRIQRRVKVA